MRIQGATRRQLFQQAIKVALKQANLNTSVFFKFAFSVCFGNFRSNSSGVLQDFSIGDLNEFIQAATPILLGQAHVLPVGVGSVGHDLRRRMILNHSVQLVRQGGEKTLGDEGSDIAIDLRRVDVGDLLVEIALGGAELPDALQLLFKVLVG